MGSLAQELDESVRASSTRAEDIQAILSTCLYVKQHEALVWIPRIKVRLAITEAWAIEPGARVLDIGCGQGESSVVLAQVLGPTSAIVGIDTARPDYGRPYNVSQSQEHIAGTEIGSRIEFHRADAAAFFRSSDRAPAEFLDAATLCHSLWYFPDRQSVLELFRTLGGARLPKIYLAEYAFQASSLEQEPHLLASKSQALFHSYKAPRPAGARTLNVRAAPDIKFIEEAAQRAGYYFRRQGSITPGSDMLEGHFEAVYTQSEAYTERVKAEGLAKEKEQEVLSYVPLIERAFEKMRSCGKDKGRAMDVWWAELCLKG